MIPNRVEPLGMILIEYIDTELISNSFLTEFIYACQCPICVTCLIQYTDDL